MDVHGQLHAPYPCTIQEKWHFACWHEARSVGMKAVKRKHSSQRDASEGRWEVTLNFSDVVLRKNEED
jgi:hypothetical protein